MAIEQPLPMVSIAGCSAYDAVSVEAALERLLEPLGGMAAFVSPDQRVLLKVNLLSKATPERAVTTHPELLRAVIRSVRRAGGMPRVGDSPGGPNTPAQWKRLAEETGIGAVCAQENVPLVLFDERVVRIASPEGRLFQSFNVGAEVAEADVLITLPKFKTHGFMMFTGAVKNLFGCIPGLEKAQYHLKVPDRHDFASMLIDLMLACKPALAIMDAVVGMEGEGPAGGQPRNIGALLAASDCVALDLVAGAMAGLGQSEVYTNRAAAMRGIGPESLEDVEVVGVPWRDLAPNAFVLPAKDLSARLTPALGRTLRGWTTARPVLKSPAQCSGCGTCSRVCPVGAISMERGRPSFDSKKCIRCYCCQELCPPQVIGLSTPPLARLARRRRSPSGA